MTPISPKAHAQGSTEPPQELGVLRLYGMRFCPYVYRVHLVLQAKNIPYETVNIHLKNKPDWYLARLPRGIVPMLMSEGHRIIESLIICDYLEGKYPEPRLWPQDPLAKAVGQMTIEDFSRIGGHLAKLRENRKDQSAFEGLKQEIDLLDTVLRSIDTPYFSGSKPGMADYMIWPFIDILKTYLKSPEFRQEPLLDKERIPHFISWSKRMREDPVVQKCDPGAELLAEFLQTSWAGTPNYDVGL